MTRTPEQVKAGDALTEAIIAYRNALVDDPAELGIITSYVVVYASKTWDDEGEGLTHVGAMFRDDAVPHYEVLGLLDFMATRMRADIARDDD